MATLSDAALNQAMEYATDVLNGRSDILPLLDTKRRQILVLMMADCYLQGSKLAFARSSALLNEVRL